MLNKFLIAFLFVLTSCVRTMRVSNLCIDSEITATINGYKICSPCDQVNCFSGCKNIGGIPICSDGKTYIVSSVDDNLDNTDMYIMSNGFDDLGYRTSLVDENTNKRELILYIKSGADTLYHTGHGSFDGIRTSDGIVSSYQLINQANTNTIIFATCNTMSSDWVKSFGKSSNIFGYSKRSWDGVDESVARLYMSYYKNGYTELVSWIMSNMSISSLNDRWVAYVRDGNNIIRHEAKSKFTPSYTKHSNGNSNVLLVNDSPKLIEFVSGIYDVIDFGKSDLILDKTLALLRDGKETSMVSIYVKTFNGFKIRGTYEIHIYDFETDMTTIISYLPSFNKSKNKSTWGSFVVPQSKSITFLVYDKQPVYVIKDGIALPGYDLQTNFGTITVLSN